MSDDGIRVANALEGIGSALIQGFDALAAKDLSANGCDLISDAISAAFDPPTTAVNDTSITGALWHLAESQSKIADALHRIAVDFATYVDEYKKK